MAVRIQQGSRGSVTLLDLNSRSDEFGTLATLCVHHLADFEILGMADEEICESSDIVGFWAFLD